MPVGIVLAGGFSTRVGQDKAQLPWGTSDLLNNVLIQLGQVCDERIVVINKKWEPSIPGIRVVSDIIPQRGPLSGIHAGLSACSESCAFITACDMPFLVPEAVRFLLSLADDWDAVLPGRGKNLEPLFAVYSRKCIPVIEDFLNQDIRKVQRLFSSIRHRLVDPDEFRQFDSDLKLFRNINTMGDYIEAKGCS
jgi:molybdopterin-guanine dinucleotide biosynthesis protein A